jgi:hypothetical protein
MAVHGPGPTDGSESLRSFSLSLLDLRRSDSESTRQVPCALFIHRGSPFLRRDLTAARRTWYRTAAAGWPGVSRAWTQPRPGGNDGGSSHPIEVSQARGLSVSRTDARNLDRTKRRSSGRPPAPARPGRPANQRAGGTTRSPERSSAPSSSTWRNTSRPA